MIDALALAPTTMLLSQHFKQADGLATFSNMNALLSLIEHENQPLLHFWLLDNTVIMGLRDADVPHLSAAHKVLTDHGYSGFIRNSGGLAVVADAGVLNISLFFPPSLVKLGVDDAYEQMKLLVDRAFPELPIDAGEVARSYCPGTYDLSVNGHKIAGMSQRRRNGGTVIMLYLSVNGNQNARAQLIHDFYTVGLGHEENKWDFPDVDPGTMMNVGDLLPQSLTIEAARQRFIDAAQQSGTQLAKQHLATLMQEPEFGAHLDFEAKRLSQHQPSF
ncbi:Lipoate-protein ligase A [Furfurilactobacillus rossiae]|uniref:lipoate--protein ligase family protein n=1 Tax=Furfurilactobacillus rossiae TaxID=231049 RepID=UPI0015BBA7D2|nr:lipoate--protein ligase family protein [Furfurilactobacillus rossiae]MCF6165704.1 lipoate--protein ligase family protein [Furfurilactobacillus rossiae]QLE63520.1 Lipoate-protein ligase A [Furfurilactobacillus rossiae]